MYTRIYIKKKIYIKNISTTIFVLDKNIYYKTNVIGYIYFRCYTNLVFKN